MKIWSVELGVVRTELFFINKGIEIPTEDDLVEEYKNISMALGKDKEAIVRTMDFGADKTPAWWPEYKEENPALGLRGVRPFLSDELKLSDGTPLGDLLKMQIKALLRANAEGLGNLKILFPMITSIDDKIKLNKIIETAKRELVSEGKSYKEDTLFGAMIEVPALCSVSEKIPKHFDFASLGTNDLLQYGMAFDRQNKLVAENGNPYNPGNIKLIKMAIEGCHNGENGKSIPCGMCGELAGIPEFIPLLLAYGLDEFSMNPRQIPEIRRLISNLNIKECKKLAEEIEGYDTAEEIQNRLEKFYREKNVQIFKKELKDLIKIKDKKIKVKVVNKDSLPERYKKITGQNYPER